MPYRSAKQPTVDWMHPSWRDLVIEHLAADDLARHAFLSKCGLSGFLLALSVAGGAKGTRQTPLLRQANDWDALRNAVPPLLRTDLFAHREVLGNLESALDAAGGPLAIDSELGRLAHDVLHELRELWTEGERLPDSTVLIRYYRVSERLSPLPPSPDLEPIWNASIEAALDEERAFVASEQEVELDEMHDWLHLADAIAENEPRFLRQIGYPKSFEDCASSLLERMKSRVELRFDLDDADDCSREETRMDLLGTIAGQLADQFEKLTLAAKEVARKARENEQRLEERRRDLESEEKSERPSWKSSIATEQSASEPNILEDIIDVNELFADL